MNLEEVVHHKKGEIMTKKDVDIFEKLSGQIISIYEEISLLSKKKFPIIIKLLFGGTL